MVSKVYPVPAEFARQTHLTESEYRTQYARSLADPEGFWSEQAERFVTWIKPWDQVQSGGFAAQDMAWFCNGKLNASANCLDRHLAKRQTQTALIWEGDDPSESRKLTYAELHAQVCRFANVLKTQGVKKGDRVCIYMPMIPEAVIAMLACVRIGAVHSVVFGGFSAEALEARILDADCHMVVTANEGMRGGKVIPLKTNVDTALTACPLVRNVIVVQRTANAVPMQDGRDVWYHEAMARASAQCEAETMDAADPLFVLYTSGSTGKPKGILHTTGGYLVYAAMTHHYIFDYHEGEIYWCTADVGWITGHTYGVYGPLLNGATTVIFEGVPHYPNFSRFWEIIDKHQIQIFYTAPTAIRALRREGDEWVERTKRTSLKLLGSVGEPINPDVWEWYYQVVGAKRCPIVDTWWQTETGGILISALPGATPTKPGSAAWPFFGIRPAVLDDEGSEVPVNQMGKLVIRDPWPGMMQTVYHNPERFVNAYFKEYPGLYFTGDDARCDEQGYYWITGRNDDVLKISGHRIGTGEVESAILQHKAIAEAAVVEVPDDIKGHSIYAFITTKAGVVQNDNLKKELVLQVRKSIGAIAQLEYVQWVDGLPKTRSGKIMRRLLRKIANNDTADLGDTSTLADPQVVESLVKNRIPMKGEG